MIWYPCKSLRVLGFVWPTRSMIHAMGEVLGFGFLPFGDLSEWQKGKQGTHHFVAIKGNKTGFHHRFEIVHLHHVILLKALLCSYELNTLDACWIAVDVWSNSSRCTKYRSTCFGRDAYRNNHCIDIVKIGVSLPFNPFESPPKCDASNTKSFHEDICHDKTTTYRVVTFPSDRRGSKARIVLFPSRVTRWAFILDMRLSIYIMSSFLRRYSVFINLIL